MQTVMFWERSLFFCENTKIDRLLSSQIKFKIFEESNCFFPNLIVDVENKKLTVIFFFPFQASTEINWLPRTLILNFIQNEFTHLF